MADQKDHGVTVPLTGSTASGSKPPAANPFTAFLAFWRREFGRAEPTRVGDLVVLPIGLSAIAGLLMGIWFEATRHLLDPAFIAYSICVDVFAQIVILILCLLLAFITRRRIWSGTLIAIAYFWYLWLPIMVHIILPGASRRVGIIIAIIGAFQIARSVNRHVHTRLGPWMIAVPFLVALCTLSYGRVREFSQTTTLPKPANSPNVLIIIVDTLRADHLSPYGYARDTSPYLNQLARQGVLFQNAIAPSSWTLPSHASMLTGAYPNDTHVETDMDDLSSTWPTLGNALSKHGYRTAAFSANYQFFSRDRGFIHGFAHFDEYEQTIGGILEKVPFSRVILQKLSGYTTGDAFAFFGLKNAADAAQINENAMDWIHRGHPPFFVVLNYFDLHEPVLPPQSYLSMYTKDAMARKQSLYFPDTCSWSEVGASCDSRRPQYLDTYDGAIRYVDDSVQQLLAQLKQSDLLENTIVVFTSDHGQEFGDHGIYGHGKSLYWREIQVPLIIWKPGAIPASVSVPTPVSTTDLPATILDLAIPGAQHELPGRSLADLWRSSDQAATWPPPFSELAKLHWRTRTAPNYNAPIDAIVTPDWHYIRQEGNSLLFDWKTDPDEAHDLCAAQPTVCADLQAKLQKAESTPQQAH
jgi:arylsulfatase A-like enzyme